MIRRHATALRIALAVVDAFMAVAVLAVAGVVRFGAVAPLEPFIAAIPNPVGALVIYTIGWPVALWSQGLYRTRARWTIRGEIVDVARATALFAVGALSLLFLVKLPDVSRTLLLISSRPWRWPASRRASPSDGAWRGCGSVAGMRGSS